MWPWLYKRARVCLCVCVCVCVNPQDLRYIANDAKDVLLLADISFVAQMARILPHIPSITAVIFLTDRYVCVCMCVPVCVCHVLSRPAL